MADDGVNSPATPEITKLSGVELRRHSTGKASSGNSVDKVLPRYLRASTGSCHDFCKYGGKHAFEANEAPSILKRVARKPAHQRSDQLRASTGSKSTKKISSVKLTASVDSALPSLKSHGIHDCKHEMLTKSIRNSKQVLNGISGNKRTSLFKVKPSNYLKSQTTDLSKTRRQETSSASKKVDASSKVTASTFKSKEMKLTSKPNSVTDKTKLSKNPSEGFSGQRNSELRMEKRVATSKVAARKLDTLSRAASINARKHKGLKIVPHLKNYSETGKDKPKQHSDVELEQKTRKNNPKQYSGLEVEDKTQKDGPEQHSDFEVEEKTRIDILGQHSDVEVEEKIKMDILGQHSDVEVEEKIKMDISGQHSDVEVEDKTLDVGKIVGESKILQSDQNSSHDTELSHPQSLSPPKVSCSSSSQVSYQDDLEESEYTGSEVEEDSTSGKYEDELIENGDDMEVDPKGRPKKDRVVDVEDKNSSQITKLKFRRGKWVESKSENSGPRRLKFRRGRVLGENENGKGEAQRKSYKRRDGEVGESNDAPTGAEKVVLRHQDVQGKKDEQGLFNNVIEETATKLAETRKSKVKALVGAFETVISLQEKKLSASTGI